MEKKPPAKFYRGELFDLTVTSENNVFGAAKIQHSIEYGINFKSEYFIEELKKIGKSEKNDKSKKRKEREELMLKIKQYPLLENLFNYLINYLNGGQTLDMKHEYTGQSLIIVLMGGNIYNIYFNLLYNIIKNNDIDFIINIFSEIMGLKEEISKIINELYKLPNYNELKKIILEKKNTAFFDSYSDLDFALLPNSIYQKNYGGAPREKSKRNTKQPERLSPKIEKKTKSKPATAKSATAKSANAELKAKSANAELKARPTLKGVQKPKPKLKSITQKKKIKLKEVMENISIDILAEEKEKLESSNGFLLYRIKSNFSISDTNIDSSTIDFFSKFKILNDTINKTYRSKAIDCKIHDLELLQIKPKDLIAHMTQTHWLQQNGVSEDCSSFIKNLLAKKNRTILCTNKNTDIICNNSGTKKADELNKLKNLISYIRKLTTTINGKYLNTPEANMNLMSTIDCFKNLYTILHNNNYYIINVCNHIIDKFYSLHETKKIINNIQICYSKVKSKVNPFNVMCYGNKYYGKIDEIKENLKKYYNSIYYNNKGTINTINLIVDDENKSKVIIGEIEPNEFFDNIEQLILDDEIDEMYKQDLNDDTIKLSKSMDTALNEEKTDVIEQDFMEYELNYPEEVKGKNKKNRITARKCKNKKYRKKHTKKCKNKKYRKKHTKKCKKFLKS